MWWNYLKIAFRSLIRNKSYSIINIFGLALGLTAFILIASFVRHEASYDRFHQNSQRIFRMGDSLKWSGNWEKLAMTSAPMGPALQNDYPMVERATRIMPWKPSELRWNEKKVTESPHFADNNFFKVFSFELAKGNLESLLEEPRSIVISETLAKKLFGQNNPLGELVTFSDKGSLKVTGVFKDFPTNSHLQYKALISTNFLETDAFGGGDFLDMWVPHNYHTYLLLREQEDADKLASAFPEFTEKYLGEEQAHKFRPFLEPLTSIYLKSDAKYGTGYSGDLDTVYLFSAISFLILLIAAVNYMNLSTARSAKRGKEVGIRKLAGGTRQSLIRQFLGEALMITLIAFGISLLLTEITLPYFNQLTWKSFEFTDLLTPGFILFLTGVIILMGFLAGLYPAFYLSAFQPVKVLKGSLYPKGQNGMRRFLVVFQFLIASGLIIATLTVYSQLDYLQSKDRGYATTDVYYFRLNSPKLQDKADVLKNELKSLPGVKRASATSRMMGNVYGKWFIKTEALPEKSDIVLLNADEDLLPALDLEVVKGRNFREDGSDKDGIILNEKAVDKYGLTTVKGQKVQITDQFEYNLIGIVKDFNYASLHSRPEPLAITYPMSPRWNRFMAVRLSGSDEQKALSAIEEKVRILDAEATTQFVNLESYLKKQYSNEARTGKIIITFSILAILIACLGLFGLSSFMMEQKRKEISIRKVLGATVSMITRQLTNRFVRWVLAANIIAWPAAYYFLERWLQHFPYHITFKVWFFLAAAVLTVLIASITVMYQTVKAAKANPAENLKYE